MKRLCSTFATVAIVIGAAIAFEVPARAVESPGQCTQPHNGEHITSSLTVPSGAFCSLYNTVVDGSILVRSGGALTINSGVSSATPSLVKGGISDQGGYVRIANSTVIGSSYLIPGAGPAIGDGGGAICASTVGTVTVTNMPTGLGYSIGGGSCESYGTSGSAYGNHINGNLTVTNNKSLVTIEGNTVEGSVTCTNNSPPPEYEDNIVKGSQNGQCKPVLG
jgi:hypothetical protein